MAAVAFLVGGLSVGQDKKGDDKTEPPTKLKGTLPPHWKKLALSEEQVQKVYKIHHDYDTKIGDLKAKMDKLEEDKKAERLKVLNDAQRTLLREILAKEAGKDEKKPDPDKKP